MRQPAPQEDPPIRIEASMPVGEPPVWAVLQRQLFGALEQGWRAFEETQCRPDGSLRYDDTLTTRDGVDDFYEPFFNWPLLYALGGSDAVLFAAKGHWEAVTAQLTALGALHEEYERGYDWFHQGESVLLLLGICAADPSDPAFRERADRFARLYLPDSPTGNYDPVHSLIRAPHTGSQGPRWGLTDAVTPYSAAAVGMRPYGLPLDDVEGITSWEDLHDPALALLMAEQMNERMGAGDCAVNLGTTSLMANRWLYDGDPAFSAWVLEYVGAWQRRADRNGGLLPDNVGTDGVVGQRHGGSWYGGCYGWQWPHGLHSVEAAALIGSLNAWLVSGSSQWLELARVPLDVVLGHARRGVLDSGASLSQPWRERLGPAADGDLLLVPYRHGRHGWFDFHPMQLAFPTWLWWASRQPGDEARLRRLCREAGYDWRTVRAFRDKEEAGHEAPWLAYLGGRLPSYPERALTMALAQVSRRIDLLDREPPTTEQDLHGWQRVNPVATEVLVQLTTGAPAALYNGGLQFGHIRYGDADRGRPGLPPDTAALVSSIDPAATRVHLVNLSMSERRRVEVRAGAFAEGRIDSVAHDRCPGGYPGSSHQYVLEELPREWVEAEVQGASLIVVLPPRRAIELVLRISSHHYAPRHVVHSRRADSPTPPDRRPATSERSLS